MLELTPIEQEGWTLLFVESRRNQPDRADLPSLAYPEIAGGKGLIISAGKLPAWAGTLSAASHYRNRCQWQAVYDPAMKGAIVVASFNPEYPVGFFVPVKLPCLACAKEGRETLLRSGAIYPYCQQYGHQNHAPERQTYKLKQR